MASGQLLGQKLAEQAEDLKQKINQTADVRERERLVRELDDVLGFDENIHSVIVRMQNDPEFKNSVFDFIPRKEIHKVDLGVENSDEEMEWDLFDQIRVSNQIPFVVMNLNRNKVNKKGLYLSDDRRFKVYQSSDVETPHRNYITNWSTETNIPYTVIIKVLVFDTLKSLSSSGKVNRSSYVDVVYRFGEGLFIEFEKSIDRGKAQEGAVNKVIAILQSHLSSSIGSGLSSGLNTELNLGTGINLKLRKLTSISGDFVIDKMAFDPALFRQILISAHSGLKIDPATGNTVDSSRPLKPYSFLWFTERDPALSMRKQYRLKFRVGADDPSKGETAITASVIISEPDVKSNNIFYLNDRPVRFKPNESYNLIRISGVSNIEDAKIVKDIVSAMFFIYGQLIAQEPTMQEKQMAAARGMRLQVRATTRSQQWADIFNMLIYGPDGGPTSRERGASSLRGDTYVGQPSKIISTVDIESIVSINKRLNAIDPTFYGFIPTGKAISKGMQPIPVTTTNDPNWWFILLDRINRNENAARLDPPEMPVQIIRYPFTVVDENGEEYPENPVTNNPPYFLMGSQNAPFFQLKVNDNPEGGNGTFHPFLISKATKQWIVTPGQTWHEQLQNLIAGIPLPQAVLDKYPEFYPNNYNQMIHDTPFQIQFLPDRKSEGSNDYQIQTLKIVKATNTLGAKIPDSLNKILQDVYTTSYPQYTDYNFTRRYSPREPESILHAMCLYGNRPEITNYYLGLNYEHRIVFIKGPLKKLINEEVKRSINWNCARQELFDMDVSQIQALFMQKNIFIDPRLFKCILEKFFKVFMLVLKYDGDKTNIEIPRHKFLHISQSSYPADYKGLLIFKHDNAMTARYGFPHCEFIELRASPSETSGFVGGGEISLAWTIPELKRLFDVANKTIDISFVDAHVISDTRTGFSTGQNITSVTVAPNADTKPDLEQIFTALPAPTATSKSPLRLQFIDGAGKTRSFVYRFTIPSNLEAGEAYEGSVPGKHSDITIMCEPMRPISLSSYNDAKNIKRGKTPYDILLPEDFTKTIFFLTKILRIPFEQLSFRLQYIDDVYKPSRFVPKPKKRTVKAPKSGKRTSNKTSNNGTTITSKGLLQQELPTASIEQKEIAVLASKQQPAELESDMVIGVWFKLQGVQFYIATEPSLFPTRKTNPELYENIESNYIPPINDTSYFEIEPEQTLFWQHDYYERVMNIMIQLARNLYIYSRYDDPVYFIQNFTAFNADVVYDIVGARRRLPSSTDFVKCLTLYSQIHPSFFGMMNAANGQSYPVLIVDSVETQSGILQHLKQVQRLKVDIAGASGFFPKKIPSSESNIGRDVVVYKDVQVDDKARTIVTETATITDNMINTIARMSEFFNRPNYIEEFYVSPSDFTVRGPDQQVFISQEALNAYMQFLDMENIQSILHLPLSPNVMTVETPQYVVTKDQTMYLLQNVIAGNLHRAFNVIRTWREERVNLGFYADIARDQDGNEDAVEDPDKLPRVNINLHKNQARPSRKETSRKESSRRKTIRERDVELGVEEPAALIRYSADNYAALIQLTRRGDPQALVK